MARLTTRIILRNDSATNWNDNSTQVLLKGEVGVELVYAEGKTAPERIKMKIGDGQRTWAELPYFGGDECSVIEVSVESGADHITAIQEAVADRLVNKGDIAVVKEKLTTDSTQEIYTAYVYGDTSDGVNWKAMDGNYRADNVYFKEDMLVTTPVGYVTLDSKGQGFIQAKGKNLNQVFESMYVKELDPTVVEPTFRFNSVTSGRYEVGEFVTPSYNVTFNKGSYSYGPDTGITADITVTDSVGKTATTTSGSFGQIQITDATSYTITATAVYGDGAIPVTNKQNGCPSKQIKGGTKQLTSQPVYGERKMFYGAFTTPVDITNGTTIRNKCEAKWGTDSVTSNGYCSGTGYTLSIPEGCSQVVVCLYGKRIKAVHDVNAFGTNIASVFKAQTNSTAISGANTYGPVEYNTYVYTPATALSANTYHIVIE